MGLREAIISVVVSLFIASLAFHFNDPTLKLINLLSWIVADYFVYRGAFGFINNLDLSNDLNLWVMRIIAAIVGILGVIFGGWIFLIGLMTDMDPLSIGLGTVLLGLVVLSIFMEFRGKRRAQGIYVWR